MIRLPRTLRLDPSDGIVFSRAAEPGEWAVPGGFAFWDEDPASMSGKRRQAFRAGFLGLGGFGWSTLVEVAEASAAARAAATPPGVSWVTLARTSVWCSTSSGFGSSPSGAARIAAPLLSLVGSISARNC